MKIITKKKNPNGRRHIYFCGFKIVSYRPPRKIVKTLNHIESQKYGKIYMPIYNSVVELDSSIPDIYNQDGRKMDMFFIRDGVDAHMPYMNKSKYFLWDRFNIGLPVHFYTHNAMLQTMGNPKKRFGWLIESQSISPDSYKIFDNNPGLEKDFDAILTYDDRLLEKLKNSVFLPGCAQVWYGTPMGGGEFLNEKAYENKNKLVSIVSSNKNMCELHNFRIALARKCRAENLADAFGTFDGGSMVKISETLSDYMYSIAIENDITDYFFTEKILNCFAAMTVPIYLGARKIDQFFNPDGIIRITQNDFDDIDKIISRCTREDYMQRLPAIKDNFKRVLEYVNMDDYLYKKLFMEN